MTKAQIASMIDHTLLKPNATRAQIEKLCDEALEYHFASVCVNTCWVPLCAEKLAGSDVNTCCVVGFPLGAMLPAAIAEETRMAVEAGADEVDMVIDIGKLKDGRADLVRDDIAAVKAAVPDPGILKVIIESAALTDDEIVAVCRAAKAAGATRFCMGAAWRAPKDRDIDAVAELVRAVKDVGLEACVTLGMLADGQAETLQRAGLDYYNHNLDCAPDFYGEVISTRDYQDRLDTLDRVRGAGVKVCSGGIVGMGESRRQRAGLLQALANLPAHPDSVPINRLVQVEGRPLHGAAELGPFEFVRTVAVARILMPKSMVRLSAGRESMSDELQALCFAAGANSIFYGEKLLTTGNPDTERDQALFARLGLRPMQVQVENVHDHHRMEGGGSGTVHADITHPAPCCGQAA